MIIKTYTIINDLSGIIQKLDALKLQALPGELCRFLIESAIRRFENFIVELPDNDGLERIERKILSLRLEAEALELVKILANSKNADDSYKVMVDIRTLSEKLNTSLLLS